MAFEVVQQSVTQQSTGTEASAPSRIAGAWLAIVSFVSIQFVEFTLFKVGDFDVSLQKVLALIAFPVALGLMGQIRLPLSLLVFFGVLILANSAAYVVQSDPLNPLLLSANATALIGFVGAVVLYTALVEDKRGLETLGRVWVIFAVLTSVLIVGQTMGLLPLLAVPDEFMQARLADDGGQLYRATGLKFNPNYQALVLVIGVVFARFYINRAKNTVSFLILLGIVGTFSRMGLLVGILAWVAVPVVQAWGNRTGSAVPLKLLATAATLAIVLAVGYLYSPQEVRSYLDQRVEEVTRSYDYFAAGAPSKPIGLNSKPIGLSSSEERILLLRVSVGVVSNNYLLGVGAHRPPDFVRAVGGSESTAHNTYLEELMIGGLLGALVIILYVTFSVRAIIKSRTEGGANWRGPSIVLLFAFGLSAMFLDLNYNSILWLPLVVALAYSKIAHPS